jgi:error-prone DNA polymerase
MGQGRSARAGLLKVDCLALGMLSAIRRALELINGFRGTAR